MQKGGNRIELAVCDYTGEAVLFSDSLGHVFLALIYKNRFSCIATNSRAHALQFLDLNRLLFAVATSDRNVKVISNTGQLVETLKGHKSKVFKIEACYTRQLLFTLSKDCLNMWDLKTFRRLRTLYPRREGFSDALFSSDGNHLMTRFEGEVLYYWSVANYEMERQLELSPDHPLTALCSDDRHMMLGGSAPTVIHVDAKTSEMITLQLPPQQY